MASERGRETRDQSPEAPWEGMLRATFRGTRAPESLRARIGAMIAVEQRMGPD